MSATPCASLPRNPGFAAVAILSLALGIGANTAIFTLIDHVMLRLLPVSHPEELMVIRNIRSYPQFEQVRDRNQVFSATIATHFMQEMEVKIEGGAPSRAVGEMVSGNYFPELGVSAAIGRTILPQDDRSAESGPVAVISNGYWKRAFGGSANVLGKKIQVRSGRSDIGTSGLDVYDHGRRGSADGAVLTIVGVAAPEFFGDMAGKSTDIWIPITMQPAVMPGRPFLTQPNAVWVNILARRKPGVSEDAARASMVVVWRQILTDAEGAQITEARRREIASRILPVESGAKGFGNVRRNFSQPLLVLMAVVGPGAADRLPERCESAARARHGAAARDRRAAVAGRGKSAADPSTAHRKPGAGAGRRRGGRHRRVRGDQAADRDARLGRNIARDSV